jgi:hypothetical protein
MGWRFLSIAHWLVVVFLCFGLAAARADDAAQETRWTQLNASAVEAYNGAPMSGESRSRRRRDVLPRRRLVLLMSGRY